MPGRETKTSHQPSTHGLGSLVALTCALTLLLSACGGGIPLPSVDNPLSTSEREALVAFYHSAGGPDWRDNTGWLEGDPIGDEVKDPEGESAFVNPDVDWYGVLINSYTRVAFRPGGGGNSYQVPFVGGLQLPANGLTGEISPKLPGLDNLRRLDLRGNRLTGQIPPELGRMDKLTHLYLSGNQLTGEIPSELGDMDGLYHLSLANNQLTGDIPPELADLGPILRELNLRGNQLTGEIPIELGSIRDLVTLDLRGNELTGEIPSELGGFRQLNRLYLGGNQFTGCIPGRLERIPVNDFLLLDLPMCDSGALPSDEIRQALVALYRSAGGDDWHDNTNWGNINNIRWYGASNRGARNPRLVTMLRLPANNLTGELPPELGSIVSLSVLDLSENNLTGRIPPELGNLDGLVSLRLGENRFTGCIPTSLHAVSDNDLLKLGLPYCALLDLYNATGGDDWHDNTNWLANQPMAMWSGLGVGRQSDPDDGIVTGIRLPDNNLTGAIPPELGEFAGTNVLDLSGNNLTGEIPSELRMLFLIADFFDLSDNQLSGPIPDDFWTIHGHGPQTLNLSNNQLSGEIPPELGGMRSLQELDLSNNQLSGEIPPELGDRSVLSFLRLGGNRFTGCIPPTLRRVKSNDLSELGLPFCGDEFPASEEGESALLALYNATGGDDWYNNTGWLTDQPIGKWFGVHRAINSRAVGRLLLPDNNLTGEIPPELGSLGSIRVLNLSGNNLSGEIPSELWDISSFHTLDLSGNQLAGEIPSELWDISSFHTLDLSGNQLAGEIPPELGSIQSIQELVLSANQLSGEIPPELGHLQNSGLRVLRLDRNNLNGEIPPELGDIRTLDTLSIRGNHFTGCIPRALRRVKANDFHEQDLPFCE